ncbi:MAG TPA: peptide-methionine (S)-S-oxide reductase [Dehalococcoidia bacterium]|jgi:peptide-methionine (S)-S-oxide reductase|nr:peptide-methionine (S)-S-oxide reductase [Dehalococcoidia bacterium]|tara:strand:+ start:231 stop:761 length:531 start_codon:yes stop_codon:yes gene_type:complete
MTETATLANGCFWCTEATLQLVKGVHQVTPGYTGGNTTNPSYREVCSGTTGHAEAVQVTFDENIITYSDLLKVYFLTHDPTTLNRQGGDVGTQYRSSIFTHSDAQRKIASDLIEDLGNQAVWANPIVTEVVDFNKFYDAEDYHLDYYKNNPGASYCTFIIEPKLAKMKSLLLDSLK